MNGAGQPGLFEDEGAHDDGHPAPAPHTMSRAEDPGTSKEAAVDLVLSGRVKGAMAKALEVLQRHPGSTAAELDYAAKTPQGAVRKRLNDLRTRGQAFT